MSALRFVQNPPWKNPVVPNHRSHFSQADSAISLLKVPPGFSNDAHGARGGE
jgi:hypothetical protein